MSTALYESPHIVVDRILRLADHDPEFRRALAGILGGLTAHHVETEQPEEAAAPAQPDELAILEGEEKRASRASPCEPQPSPTDESSSRQPWEPFLADLSSIETSCRLKAKGARWAAERQRCINGGQSFASAIEPRDRDLLERAASLECHLWMNGRSSPQPADLGLFDVLGSCFETAADAAALLRECALEVEDKELFQKCLEVAAEAQSALRSAVTAVEANADVDQQSLFIWIRETAREERTFIQRHLRADDPADPFTSSEIQDRLQAVRGECQAVIDRRRRQTRLANRLRYHAKLIRENGGSDHDWNIVAQVADEMVQDGVPPSNREIRDAMLPILDLVPMADGFPQAFHLVLREAKTYRTTRSTVPPEQEDAEPTADVLAVRKLLKGKTIVLIGGDFRKHAQQALKEAFELGDLVWGESRPHQSIEKFKPVILRPDVKIVVLMIRWTSHSYSDLKSFCERHGRLFVRLPSGYNPNQLAGQIMAQCGYLLNREICSVSSN